MPPFRSSCRRKFTTTALPNPRLLTFARICAQLSLQRALLSPPSAPPLPLVKCPPPSPPPPEHNPPPVAHQPPAPLQSSFATRPHGSLESDLPIPMMDRVRVFAFYVARLIPSMGAAFFSVVINILAVGKLATAVSSMTSSFLQLIHARLRNVPSPLPSPLRQPRAIAILHSTASLAVSDTVEAFQPSSRTLPCPIATTRLSDSPLSSPLFARPDRADCAASSPDRKRRRIKSRLKSPKHSPGERLALHPIPTNAPDPLLASGDRFELFHSPSSTECLRMKKSSEEAPPSKPRPDSFKQIPAHHKWRNKQHVASENALSIATIGVLIGLIGLLAGRLFAIMGVICWWYANPHVEPNAGSLPTVCRVKEGMTDRKLKRETYVAPSSKAICVRRSTKK